MGDKIKTKSDPMCTNIETGEIGDGKREKTNNNIPTPMLPPPTPRTDNNRPVVAARQTNAVHEGGKKGKE